MVKSIVARRSLDLQHRWALGSIPSRRKASNVFIRINNTLFLLCFNLCGNPLLWPCVIEAVSDGMDVVALLMVFFFACLVLQARLGATSILQWRSKEIKIVLPKVTAIVILPTSRLPRRAHSKVTLRCKNGTYKACRELWRRRNRRGRWSWYRNHG